MKGEAQIGIPANFDTIAIKETNVVKISSPQSSPPSLDDRF